MELIDQNRVGIDKGMGGVKPNSYVARLTTPAKEALERHGAEVRLVACPDYRLYAIQLRKTVPDNLVVVSVVGDHNLAIRTKDEPEYPDEIRTYWEQADFLPCPKCGYPLVWYEAGYVPGYRVCSGRKHHHWIVGGKR